MKVSQAGVGILAIALLAATARAEGWSLSGLNPFAKKPARTGQRGGKPAGAAASKPGVLSTVTAAPKKAWNSTKSLLAPGKKAPVRKTTGLQSSREFHPEPEKKDSWARSLFAQEEPKPPQSVGEWMRLKQIKPGLSQ